MRPRRSGTYTDWSPTATGVRASVTTVAKKQQENMNQKLALVIKSGKYKLGKQSFVSRVQVTSNH